MGRRKFLEQALPTWLPVNQFNRIIIVDWGARENLPDLVKLDKRIVVLQAPGKITFDPGAAWNAGVRYSESDYVFQIDCDIKLTAVEGLLDLLKGIILGEYFKVISLWHNYTSSPSCFGGTMLYERKVYYTMNGFLEGLEGWGVEDGFFVPKAKRMFKNNLLFDRNWFQHITHDSKSRICNLTFNNITKTKGNEISWAKARSIDFLHQDRPKFNCIEYTSAGRRELVV
jgi:glycosyltransferase involved in cell wall biosynthesis